MDARVLGLVSIVALLVLAMLFAASEAAILAVSRLRVLQRHHSASAQRLLAVVDDRNTYLTTILVGNTIVLLSADSLATWVALQYDIWKPVLVATVAITIAVLLFGEVIPKMVAVQDANRWLLRLIPFLRAVIFILRPVTWAIIGLTSLLIRAFGGDPHARGPYLTEDDIRTLVEVGESQGVLEEEETEMIHSIFEFGDTAVREIMTPRTDMVVADASAPARHGVDLVIREGYSKIPIYEGNIDRLVGVVHDRELLVALYRGQLDVALRTLARPVKAIPENKKIDELLREMQAEKVSLAIVVDEYGGTAGLVTMEDLLEEIVGEIMDEYDAEEHDNAPEIQELGDDEFVVDARMSIDDVNERLGLSLPTEDFESIGGYTFGLFGRVPQSGEKVSIDGGVTLTVDRTAGRRLLAVRVHKTSPNDAAAANGRSMETERA